MKSLPLCFKGLCQVKLLTSLLPLSELAFVEALHLGEYQRMVKLALLLPEGWPTLPGVKGSQVPDHFRRQML